MTRRFLILLTLCALAAFIYSAAHPINSTRVRLVTLASLVFLLAVGLRWVWPSRWGRCCLIAIYCAAAALFFIPSRGTSGESLREDYVANLSTFEGVDYYWGGENGRGIDCSGLPRRALRDALLADRQFSKWLEHWWFDSSALALQQGYRDYARPLGISGTVETIDDTQLQPGDLAITDTGRHVIVFVEPGRWIQADPGEDRVLTLDPKKDDNYWFGVPVGIYRWSLFSDH